jgi:hypothetical protein
MTWRRTTDGLALVLLLAAGCLVTFARGPSAAPGVPVGALVLATLVVAAGVLLVLARFPTAAAASPPVTAALVLVGDGLEAPAWWLLAQLAPTVVAPLAVAAGAWWTSRPGAPAQPPGSPAVL